jgi:hypothetical protein
LFFNVEKNGKDLFTKTMPCRCNPAILLTKVVNVLRMKAQESPDEERRYLWE